jgi:hypothetical protein
MKSFWVLEEDVEVLSCSISTSCSFQTSRQDRLHLAGSFSQEQPLILFYLADQEHLCTFHPLVPNLVYETLKMAILVCGLDHRMDPSSHYCYRTLNILRVKFLSLDNPVRSILAENIKSIENSQHQHLPNDQNSHNCNTIHRQLHILHPLHRLLDLSSTVA